MASMTKLPFPGTRKIMDVVLENRLIVKHNVTFCFSDIIVTDQSLRLLSGSEGNQQIAFYCLSCFSIL